MLGSTKIAGSEPIVEIGMLLARHAAVVDRQEIFVQPLFLVTLATIELDRYLLHSGRPHGGSPFKVSQPDSFRIRLDRRSTFNYSRDTLTVIRSGCGF